MPEIKHIIQTEQDQSSISTCKTCMLVDQYVQDKSSISMCKTCMLIDQYLPHLAVKGYVMSKTMEEVHHNDIDRYDIGACNSFLMVILPTHQLGNFIKCCGASRFSFRSLLFLICNYTRYCRYCYL